MKHEQNRIIEIHEKILGIKKNERKKKNPGANTPLEMSNL